jgi:hypothetical protein
MMSAKMTRVDIFFLLDTTGSCTPQNDGGLLAR